MSRIYYGKRDFTKIYSNVNYYEALGRGYLTEVLNNHLKDKSARVEIEFTKQTCKHDAEGFLYRTDKSGNETKTPVLFEIKCRKTNPVENDLITSKGLFIEEPKYIHLLDEATKRKAIPFYINFFNDGSFIMYNLRATKILGVMPNVRIGMPDGSHYFENRVLLPVDSTNLRYFPNREQVRAEIMKTNLNN